MDGNNIVEKGKEVIKKCITGGITKDVVEYAEKLGKELKKNNFSTSQIRNIYGTVKKIEMKGYIGHEDEILLLKPKLAYVAKRGKKGAQYFKEVFSEGINAIGDSQDKEKAFRNFCKFLEAVVAYHKAAGGD